MDSLEIRYEDLDDIVSADNNLRIANKKIQEVTIKKLTKDSPIIAEKLSSIRENKNK